MIVIKVNYTTDEPIIKVNYDESPVYIRTSVDAIYIKVDYGTGGGGSGSVWGDITGTLSNQLDLQAALDDKLDIPSGTTLDYIDGTGALQTFPLTLPVLQQVRNQTGSSVAAGSVVYINGATGNKPTIALAIATGDPTSAQTLGMVQTTIANNGVGYVVVIGTCGNLDTSAYTEGQQLYLSGTVAGGVTTTKPYAPTHLVYIGIVTRQHPTLGTIEVRVQNGAELEELHNVSAQSPNNNDGIFYNTSTSLWEHKQISTALGYTPGTVSSVALSVPTGLVITSGSPITTSGTIAIGLQSGYSIPTTVKQGNWDDAYTFVSGFPTQTGNSGKYLTTDGSTLSWGTVSTANIYNSDGTLTGNRTVTTSTNKLTFSDGTNGMTFKNVAPFGGLSGWYGLFGSGVTPSNTNYAFAISANGNFLALNSANGIYFNYNDSPKMYLSGSSGNFIIGGSTDAGYKLDCQGTGRFTGQVNIIDSSSTSGTGLSMFGNSFSITNSGGFRVLNFTNGAITVTGGNNFIISNNSIISLYSSASTSPIRLGNSSAHIEVTNNSGVDKITLKPSLFRGDTPQYLDIVSNDATVTYGQRSGSIRIFTGEQASTNGYGYIVLAHNGTAQRGTVAIGATTTHASALLDVTSTTQGFLPPRMTTVQRDAISTPATGLTVYNTTLNTNDYYNGTSWVSQAAGNIYTADGTLTGNRTLTANGNSLTFLGGNEATANEQRGLIIQTSATNKTSIELLLNNTFTTTGKTWRLRSLSGGDFDIVTGSSRYFYIANDGKVVVNGSSAISSAQFSVSGKIATNEGIQLQGAITSPSGSGVEIEYNGGVCYFTGYNRTASSWHPIYIRGNNILFQTAGNDRVSITNAGRLLLGTTTESTYLLDVNGTGRFTGEIRCDAVNGNFYLSNATSYITWSNIGFIGTGNVLVGGSASNQLAIRFANGVVFGSGSAGYHYLTTDYALFSTQSSANNLATGIPASAVLEARSTTKGFLPPRMTAAQRGAISSPAVGLVVYQTDSTEGLYENTSTGWRIVNASGTTGGITRSVNVISTPTTAAAAASTDYVYLISGTTTLTLPTAVGNTNRYTLKNVGTNTVTINTTSSQTIDGSTSITMSVRYTALDVISDGTNWNII
jgi:hypothetical protein